MFPWLNTLITFRYLIARSSQISLRLSRTGGYTSLDVEYRNTDDIFGSDILHKMLLCFRHEIPQQTHREDDTLCEDNLYR